MYSLYSRIENATNPYQGAYKKVLCVCSAGILRSPTAAMVLTQKPFGYNTRAAGIEETYALIIVDKVLLAWADEIICMTKEQQLRLCEMTTKPVYCLDIEDNFEYRNPRLIKKIRKECKKIFLNE